ncbi:hypothetical protein GCM10025762_02900 [Haloechinothrix salitolerans]
MNLSDAVTAFLPTPAGSNPNDGEEPADWLRRQARQKARGINGNGMGMPLSIAVRTLRTTRIRRTKPTRPSPRSARRWSKVAHSRDTEATTVSGTAVENLHSDRASSAIDWDIYETAIRRWESVCGVTVPHPTESSRSGRPRLAPRFVEWLMGVPTGWVTEVPITPAAQVRCLGNGVVPQQCRWP